MASCSQAIHVVDSDCSCSDCRTTDPMSTDVIPPTPPRVRRKVLRRIVVRRPEQERSRDSSSSSSLSVSPPIRRKVPCSTPTATSNSLPPNLPSNLADSKIVQSQSIVTPVWGGNFAADGSSCSDDNLYLRDKESEEEDAQLANMRSKRHMETVQHRLQNGLPNDDDYLTSDYEPSN